MDRSARITIGACAGVVIGLVALAAPTVGMATSTLWKWAGSDSVADVDFSTDRVVLTQTPTAEDHPDTEGGSGSLVYAGDGTWFSAEGPGNCPTNAAIHPYGAHDPRARLGGELIDMGVTSLASGEVGYTTDGLIESYTVAAGDSLIGIGERFCVDYVTVGAYNDRFGSNVIQPGDVLILRP